MGRELAEAAGLAFQRQRQIESILSRVRPALRADGVRVELLEVSDNGASVSVTGLRPSCSSGPLTMHTGLLELLREHIPDFAELRLVHDLSTRPGSHRPGTSKPRDGDDGRDGESAPAVAPAVLIGDSARMQAVLDFIRSVSASDSTVVIRGESGTGKEVTASLIHDGSRRRHKPFVPVSCALFSETLVESELFGHEKGAFTGAVRDRPGRFEMAEGGTVFLDDIDDVPLSMQVKLLRVLQNRTIERLGGVRTVPVNVRVIAGTKRDLKRMVEAGTFREDLFYRLNVLPVALPPLRERREDIPALMEHFLTVHSRRRGTAVPGISPGVTEAFLRYRWPGNVRELENACERITQTCTCGTLGVGCVALEILAQAPEPSREITGVPLDDRLRDMEAGLIGWALGVGNGSRTRAAGLLHLKRSTLGDRMRRCGLGDQAAALELQSPVAGAATGA
ncbi:MAG: sigma 54-interacting transcriptional regulator [Vicinamibacterales bacterium]